MDLCNSGCCNHNGKHFCLGVNMLIFKSAPDAPPPPNYSSSSAPFEPMKVEPRKYTEADLQEKSLPQTILLVIILAFIILLGMQFFGETYVKVMP